MSAGCLAATIVSCGPCIVGRKYNKFTSNGVFASRIKFGWVTAFGKSTEVPTKERFYLGGAYTVRGFGENALGPVDSTR